jgi:primosomal protein N''
MTSIHDSVQILAARLPELVWKLSTLRSVFNPKLLPRGLFNAQLEMTPQSCIDEINADLRVLKDHKNERSVHYLALRVSQKINVLVRLCQLHADKKPAGQPLTFGVQEISTRQQWLGNLQADIVRLSAQQLALTSALGKLQTGHDPQAILSLQAEVGEIERRLTLARETLNRAIA